MIVYIDITSLEKGRANTGIQRVVKEYISRLLDDTSTIEYRFLLHNEDFKFHCFEKNDIKNFLDDYTNYQFTKNKTTDFESYNEKPQTTIFFDIDSNWNLVCARNDLYPILKKYDIYIFNFIYDLIPIILPQFAHENTAKNFKKFISAIYKYTDTVLFDSQSASDDFYKLKEQFNCKRDISTRVVHLGSDFTNIDKIDYDLDYESILSSKYILFVGTIEPRKSQDEVLQAFDSIQKEYPDTNLIFIGRQGWYVDSLIEKINNHELKDKRVFWFNNIDDNTLKAFYKNAYIVTYISKYEGYGLPIAESLGFGNITITSNNSSMYEVARDYADYINYNSLNELSSILSLYLSNKEIYDAKKQYIKDNFTVPSWNKFYNSVVTIFNNFEKSKQIMSNHLTNLQFVFISIDMYNLEGTIKAIDENCDFVKEYIIVTSPKLLSTMEKIPSKHKITVIDENIILKDDAKNFQKYDHQTKNWLLRLSLLNLDNLENEFIMLDDDNRPIKKISIDKFINKDGKYNAYYFYNLLEWKNYNTEYDFGQLNTKDVLISKNYEFLSYSSHAPQIINKALLEEIKEEFYDLGKQKAIDEWSTYFNTLNSKYPYLFNKKPFETICWPLNPSSWEAQYKSNEITFENYYKETYDLKYFDKNDNYEDKVNKVTKLLNPNKKTKEHFNSYQDILSKNNMTHKYLDFSTEDISLYIFSLPYFLILEKDSDIKLKLNYKLINKLNQDLDISIVTFINGDYRSITKLSFINNQYFQDNFFELNIPSTGLGEGVYNLEFDVMISNKYVYNQKSPYMLKLFTIEDKNPLDIIENPKKIGEIYNKPKEDKNMKDKIKSIPLLGWFARWLNNILRLNNLKYRVHRQGQIVAAQQEQIHKQLEQITMQQKQIKQLEEDVSQIDRKIAKELSFHIDSYEQRIEQFIFDAKHDLKIDNE